MPQLKQLWIGLVVLASVACAAEPEAAPEPQQQGAKSSAADAQIAEFQRLARLAIQLRTEGKYSEAICQMEQVLSLMASSIGELHETRLMTMRWVAETHLENADPAGAERAQAQLVAARRKAHGPRDWRAKDAELALARFHRMVETDPEGLKAYQEASRLFTRSQEAQKTKQWADAIRLQQEAIEVRRRVFGEEQWYANGLTDLGELYDKAGDLARSREMFERALAIRRRELGDSHPDTATSLQWIARACSLQRDYALAERLSVEASTICKQAFGEEDLRFATSLVQIGHAQYNQSKLAAAEASYSQALAIRRKLLGDKHLDVAAVLGHVGDVLAKREEWAPAQAAYEEAAALTKLAVGKQSLEYEDRLAKLGRWYLDRKNYRQAESALRLALQIRKEQRDEHHLEYAYVLSDLGHVLRSSERLAEAEQVYQQAIKIVQANPSPDAAFYPGLLNSLAHTSYAAGNYDLAESRYTELLALREKLPKGEQEDIAGTHVDLAWVYRRKKDFQKAETHYQKSLAIKKRLHGEYNLGDASVLRNLGTLYYDELRDYRKAEQVFAEVLAVRERLLPAEHADLAVSLQDVADCLYGQGLYVRAEPIYRRAVELQRRITGERHKDYVSRVVALANNVWGRGRYLQAEPLYEQALAIRNQLGETPGSAHAQLYSCLGMACEARGAHARAGELLETSVGLYRQAGPPDAALASSLSRLAYHYRSVEDLDRAEQLYRESLQIRQQLYGKEHVEYAISLTELGELSYIRDDYPTAEELLVQAVNILDRNWGRAHPQSINASVCLAKLYVATADYARAHQVLQKLVIAIDQTGDKNHPSLAFVLGAQGALYSSMGDKQRAESLCLQALSVQKLVAGEETMPCAALLADLGWLYVDTGMYELAAKNFEQALAIIRKCVGETNPQYARCLNGLAMVFYEQNDFARAEPLLLESLELKRKTGGENNESFAASLNNLARLRYYVHNDVQGANACYQQLQDLRKRTLGPSHPTYAYALANSARVRYYGERDFDKAESLARQALDIHRRSLDRTFAVQSERQQLLMSEEFRGTLNLYLSICGEAGLPPEMSYGYLLAWKGAVFARQRNARSLSSRPELAANVAALRRTTSELSAMVLNETLDVQVREQRLAELTEAKERLQREVAQKCPELQRPEPAQLVKRVQASLAPGTVLVDLINFWHVQPPADSAKGGFRVSADTVAFVVRSDQPVARIELGPVHRIDMAIAAWRNRNAPGSAGLDVWSGLDLNFVDPLKDLRELVWQKLGPYLKGADTLLISPDGDWARFPWAALEIDSDTYLIEKLAVGIVPFAAQLGESGETGVANQDSAQKLLVLGDVNYNAPTTPLASTTQARSVARGMPGSELKSWKSLPGTEREIAAIEETFRKRYAAEEVIVLRGAAASKRNLCQQAPSCRVLHIASHGFFAPEAIQSALGRLAADTAGQSGGTLSTDLVGFHPGLLSGIVLAGANRDASLTEDDGILTALEVAELDLSHVELATLSACETGLGKSAGGEGLLGLQRAFQSAGAKAVLASLWKVPDQATQVLMTRFYDNLWSRGMTRLKALQEAQVWMLREGRKHPGQLRGLIPAEDADKDAEASRALPPYYWAAFVLSGPG